MDRGRRDALLALNALYQSSNRTPIQAEAGTDSRFFTVSLFAKMLNLNRYPHEAKWLFDTYEAHEDIREDLYVLSKEITDRARRIQTDSAKIQLLALYAVSQLNKMQKRLELSAPDNYNENSR